MSNKTYFISGGGTGGHIYPAFTVIEQLLKEPDTNKIFFIGNPDNLEFEISKNYPEVEFLPVNISGMPRKLNFSLIKWGLQLFSAVKTGIKYINKYKPNAIFATGGYVSAPVILAAMISNKPYMIHDCDSVPGLVSKLAAPKAKIVSVAFETSKNVLKSDKIIVNGNPIREVFFNVTKEDAKNKLGIFQNEKLIIFAMGGSQGAKSINNAMIEIIKQLHELFNAIIIFQTGKKNYNDVCSKLEEIYPEYKSNPDIMVRPYFNELVYPLKSADIVISRAGSVSLSEILCANAAAVLIPYPFAAQDHQRKNAKEFYNNGLALYLEDKDCNGENLLKNISELLGNKDLLACMQNKIKTHSLNNATLEIVKQLKSII